MARQNLEIFDLNVELGSTTVGKVSLTIRDRNEPCEITVRATVDEFECGQMSVTEISKSVANRVAEMFGMEIKAQTDP